jgi:hypothetical protein
MAQQGIDYAKLAAQSGGRPVNPPPATVDYDALARASGGQPQTAPTGAPPTDTGGVSGFLREFWKQVNPLAIAQGIGQTVMHPIETGKTVLGAQGALLDKARASADQGDYVTATRHFMNYLLPLVGPGIDAAGDLMQEGRTAEGLGASTGLGVMLSAGGVKAPTKPVAPLRNQNPAVAAAVKQGQAAGVPIDLATASGNSFVANTQKVLGQTLGGSVAGGRAVRKQAQKLEEHGRQLASDVHPGAITPLEPPQSMRCKDVSRDSRVTRIAPMNRCARLRRRHSRSMYRYRRQGDCRAAGRFRSRRTSLSVSP